jgi:hypothetical protein
MQQTPLFLLAMCVKTRYPELRYATEDYKVNLRDRIKYTP